MSKTRLAEVLASAIFIVVLLHSYGIESVLDEIRNLSAQGALLALLAVFGSFVMAFARFRVVVALFGFTPPASAMARAFAIGQFSNQFLANIFGQSIGRAALLHQSGVPFSATVFATWAERALALFILLVFSTAGAALFIGNFGLSIKNGGAYLVSVVFGCGVALIIAFAIAVWRFGTGVLGAWPRQRVALALLAALLTAATHGMMLLAYMVCLSSLGIDPWRTDVAAALLIVIMVSSLPISFAGWGLRELSAAHALALVGIAAPIGIAVGVMIGIVSLIAMAVMALLLAVAAVRGLAKPREAAASPLTLAGTLDWDSVLLWICSLLIAALVFFHIHVPLSGGIINVNPADAVALTALCIALLSLFVHRSPGFIAKNWMWPGVGALMALIAFGLVVAYANHGGSQWALLNRGIGWFVILGYVVAGAAAGQVAGERGRETILLAFAALGLALFAYQLAALGLGMVIDLPSPIVTFPLEGFAANSNAFALQIIFVLIANIVLVLADPKRKWLLTTAIALSWFVIFFTWSRTGWILYLLLIGATVVVLSQMTRIRTFLLCAFLTSIVGMMYMVSAHAYLPSAAQKLPSTHVAKRIAKETEMVLQKPRSDAERWQTIEDGLTHWRSSPIVGVGLGGHMASKVTEGEKPIVIHSTPIWILAEFGILGLVVVIIVGWRWIRYATGLLVDTAVRPYAIGFLALLCVMAVGGLVHDLAYQRIFWFLAALMSSTVPSQERTHMVHGDQTGKIRAAHAMYVQAAHRA